MPIHPNTGKATRPHYRSHSAKSDASDAYLLADLLRTDGHRVAPLAPQGDEIRPLRALVRGRDDLVATRVQLANQLRSLLETFWPGAAAIFADIDSPSALAFIERYPTPEAAARLGPKRLAAVCAQHGYCGRRHPEALLARLREAPAPACGELEMEANGELVRCLARTLARLVEQIRLLTSRVEHHMASLDDGRIVMSFPRAGRICAAQILAEVGVQPGAATIVPSAPTPDPQPAEADPIQDAQRQQREADAAQRQAEAAEARAQKDAQRDARRAEVEAAAAERAEKAARDCARYEEKIREREAGKR